MRESIFSVSNFVCDMSFVLIRYGGFLKWWYPQNTPKWLLLVGKRMVVGYHHFRKHPYTPRNFQMLVCILPFMVRDFTHSKSPVAKWMMDETMDRKDANETALSWCVSKVIIYKIYTFYSNFFCRYGSWIWLIYVFSSLFFLSSSQWWSHGKQWP